MKLLNAFTAASLFLLATLGTAHAADNSTTQPAEEWAPQLTRSGLLAASEFSRTFELRPTGPTALSRPMTLSNRGTLELKVAHIEVQGDSSSFSVSNGCDDKVLAPGRSCTVFFVFNPKGSPGIKEALIRVKHTGLGVRELALVGTVGPYLPASDTGRLDVAAMTRL